MTNFNTRKKKISFLCLIIFSLFFSYGASGEEGIAIILYGTPSAGKTTLANQLTHKLPGNFKILKKTPFVEAKKREFIYQKTGRRVSGRKEMVEAIEAMPDEMRVQTHKFTEEGIMDSIEKIHNLTSRGENVIFDLCLSDIEKLKDLKCKNIFVTLIYAPLKTISKREFQRVKHNNDSPIVAQKRRNAILHMFFALYAPKAQDSDDYIDVLTRDDLRDFFLNGGNNLLVPRLKETYDRVYRGYDFSRLSSKKIYPISRHDLFIDTSAIGASEAARKVKEAVEKKFPFLQKLSRRSNKLLIKKNPVLSWNLRAAVIL